MPSFETNVFINCPLDEAYLPLLRPLIFTVAYLKFTPRLALERSDSGEVRIEKIIELIEESQFAIHDLSRCRASKVGELFRLNMPLELGIDIGCKRFKQGKWQKKRCLILETERYRYQAAISDLSNSDIFAHGNDPQQIVIGVRNWLVQEAKAKPVPSSVIQGAFLDFMTINYLRLRAENYTKSEIEKLPIAELKSRMLDWINEPDPRKAIPVPGRPNIVRSPYAPSKFVDVKGYAPGSQVRCPYTGRVFRI
jgi:hypothetical protein